MSVSILKIKPIENSAQQMEVNSHWSLGVTLQNTWEKESIWKNFQENEENRLHTVKNQTGIKGLSSTGETHGHSKAVQRIEEENEVMPLEFWGKYF